MRFDPIRSMQELLREFRTKPVTPDVETLQRFKMDVSEDDQAYYYPLFDPVPSTYVMER